MRSNPKNSSFTPRPFRAARFLGRACVVLLLCLGAWQPARADHEDWPAVAREDLAAKSSQTFPGADAEILLKKQKYEDGMVVAGYQDLSASRIFKGVLDHFERIKIYTAKGVELKNQIRILHEDYDRVTDLGARVVKPDGTAVELTKADFIESVIADEDNGGTLKQVAFALAGLEPGDVVDFRWKTRYDGPFWMISTFVQEAFPIREFQFYLKEMGDGGALWWEHCPNISTQNKHGFTLTSRDIPAFESEEHMPPMREERGWCYVTREYPGFDRDSEIWPLVSHFWAADFEHTTSPRGSIRQKAESLVAGSSTEEEKLQRLYAFCQSGIVNADYFANEQIRRFADKHLDQDAMSPTEVLSAGRARSGEINLLFAALARAAGFEVRTARFPLNTELTSVKIPRAWAFFRFSCVAVKVGAGWRFFDPGSYFEPFGLIDPLMENVTAVVCDLRKLQVAEIPASTSEANQERGKANLSLSADGALEGDVEEMYFGQLAAARKDKAEGVSDDDVGKAYAAEVTKRVPNAEVTRMEWTNLRTNVLPLKVAYHVRVRGYAQTVGKRLVVTPSFFRVGCPPAFTAPNRKYPVFFPYPWSEHDEVELKLPEGYVFDRASAPMPVGGANAGVLSSAYRLRFNPKTHALSYQRDFAMGAGGACRFQAESYPAIKELFDLLHKSDNHALMLKPAAPTPAAVAPAGPSPVQAARP